ncbi:hypothetical protein GCM10011490_07470 [Pseudoclavibacter endophyticus]|nr:hypothetical protein GCM10011490_07470 [Pseudoclavibacter endophyticus]
MADRITGRDADLSLPRSEGRRWWRPGRGNGTARRGGDAGGRGPRSGRDERRGTARRQRHETVPSEQQGERGSKDRLGRLMETFARGMGTPAFLIALTLFCVAWLVWNSMLPEHVRFDSAALGFTALTLMLSLQASYAAPMLLLAQNRQDDRDRVQIEQDRQRAERNTADLEYLARELVALRMLVADMASKDFIRAELRSLLEDLEELEALDDAAGDAPDDGTPPERTQRERLALRRARAAEADEYRERDVSEQRRRAKVRREAEAEAESAAEAAAEAETEAEPEAQAKPEPETRAEADASTDAEEPPATAAQETND